MQRIAVNTRFLLSGKMEGMGWYLHEILSRMVKAHPEVEFHFFFDRKYDQRFIYGPNVIPHVLFPPARHPILWYWWFEFSVRRMLSKISADLFWSPDNYNCLGAPCPTVMTLHDVPFMHHPQWIRRRDVWYLRKFTQRWADKAEHIFAVSQFTKDDLIEKLRLPADKITVTHNAVAPRFQPIPPEKQQQIRDQWTGGVPYVLFPSAMHPRKNVLRLCQAFSLAKEQKQLPHVLVLAGRLAWHTHELQSIMEDGIRKGHYIYIPYLDQELPEVMGAATIVAYPSIFEGFGMPVLEAMACGVPVLTSPITALPEVGGNAAIYTDPVSIEDLSEKLIQLLTQDSLREQCRVRGLDQVKKFSWDTSSQKTWNAIEQILLKRKQHIA